MISISHWGMVEEWNGMVSAQYAEHLGRAIDELEAENAALRQEIEDHAVSYDARYLHG